MEKLGFWQELIRRKVVKVTASYIAVAWVLIQVADIALESFGAPDYLMQAFILFTILGIPVVLVLSWALEVTPTGIRTERRRSGSELREAIAVLPFANMSSDDEVEHMADGLSDNIITVCQQVLGIDVTSRNSTFVYKNQPVTITSVARELDVAYILEGSIQKRGDVVRVTAQLINAADDSHLWADHFDREELDAFRLQDELTGKIVSHIESALRQDEPDTVVETKQPALLVGAANLPPLLLFSLVGVALFFVIFGSLTLLPGRPGEAWLDGLSFELAGGLLLLVTLAGLFGYHQYRKSAGPALDVSETVAQIEELVSQAHNVEAFDLARDIKDLLDTDTYDDAWWDRFSAICRIKTNPGGASVAWRPYNGRNIDWRDIGDVSESGIRLPIASLQFRISHPGYTTQEFAAANPSQNLHNPIFSNEAIIEGVEESRLFVLSREVEEGMVYASERLMMIGLTGIPFRGVYSVNSFFIDTYPVSNAEYLEFVQAGGYGDDPLWESLPWPDDVDRRQCISSFVDRTEQPGPAGWELGRFPDGEEDMPVTGICWYEASAYASWRGKRLPTVHEWARAALPMDSSMTPIPVAMMNFSNFHAKGKHPRGDYPALNAIGCYDMFGNVREWAYNEVNEGRANLGGCDSDLPYFAVWANSENPLTRDENHGFRCCKGTPDPVLLERIERADRTYEGEEPVKQDVFDALVKPLEPDQRPVNPECLESIEMDGGLVLSKYLIDSGYGERMPLYLARPPGEQPTPSLVTFPGMGSFMGSSMESDVWDLASRLDFLVRQLGCSLIFPCWTGAFERFDGGPFPTEDPRDVWFTRIHNWVQEASQAVTFAETADELLGDRVGFLGVSFGATNTLPILALEKRLKTAMLFSGSLMSHYMFSFADAKNYLPRVTMPVLFINGRYDTIVNPSEEITQLRLSLLGSEADSKKQVRYDAGHWPFPQHLFKKEVADWLAANL